MPCGFALETGEVARRELAFRARPIAVLTPLLLLVAMSGCERLSRPGQERWTPPAEPAVGLALQAREPCAQRDPERRAFFGDLHVHTGYSMDARAWTMPATPDDAYRFATGATIELPAPGRDGEHVRLHIDRPLDFAAVTDHAEWIGEVSLCTTPGSPVYDVHGCRVYRGEAERLLAKALGIEGFAAKIAGIAGFLGRNRDVCGDDARLCRSALATAWQDTREAAERWYDRSRECRFTTFVGWEYSQTPGGSKVHRNVILRNELAPELPLSWIDTPTPRELRQRLRELCTENGSGCDAIAIPHNPNLGNGRHFAPDDLELPVAERRARAAERAALEPVVEMMQIKGESECRNGFAAVLGGPDELCDFEKIRDMPGQPFGDCGDGTGSKGESRRGCISRFDYVRTALIEGLREQQRLGVNPLAFGLIGSTDNHAAAPGAVEETRRPLGRWGVDAVRQLTIDPERRLQAMIWENPGGLAGVWAEENSRDALFDALERREVFATSGPRIRPRLFAGFGLPMDLCERGDLVARADAAGVPMGGVLAGEGAGRPLRFALHALRDPGTARARGGLLERIQIVKGWLDDEGRPHQAVIHVAGHARRRAAVDLATCEPSGPGFAQLCGVWEDPDFDPTRPALYYGRVIENPSCRWSTRACNALPPAARPNGCADPAVPRIIQERAWTSPIWVVPAAQGA